MAQGGLTLSCAACPTQQSQCKRAVPPPPRSRSSPRSFSAARTHMLKQSSCPHIIGRRLPYWAAATWASPVWSTTCLAAAALPRCPPRQASYSVCQGQAQHCAGWGAGGGGGVLMGGGCKQMLEGSLVGHQALWADVSPAWQQWSWYLANRYQTCPICFRYETCQITRLLTVSASQRVMWPLCQLERVFVT
jgi:hypothetical protein